MRVLSSIVSLALLSVTGAVSIPRSLHERSVTTLSLSALDALAPYTEFARAAYCSSSSVQGWNCGDACSAVPGFQVTLTGGDGDAVQLFYVGYWPAQNAVVVAHEGTDPTQFLSDLTDIEIVMDQPDTSLFPGIPSSVWVHGGFLAEHAKTAPQILAETKSLLSSTGADQVILVGHSLGGALAEIDWCHLRHPPVSVTPAWASYFDSEVSDFQHINNELDPIPIVPGRGLGFAHPHGEVHILGTNDAVAALGTTTRPIPSAPSPPCPTSSSPTSSIISDPTRASTSAPSSARKPPIAPAYFIRHDTTSNVG
ncbi:hypothetical protein NM688_g7157 [Phlebia brevispora]|uniref:Uncharacterized protein n=1 Tax=Phlebia brevispora TaxID=194682 RepID=A0ACC1S8L3_9APHY|nr:hypothetical protein NM688_g7157 [Phlebia brevispora]